MYTPSAWRESCDRYGGAAMAGLPTFATLNSFLGVSSSRRDARVAGAGAPHDAGSLGFRYPVRPIGPGGLAELPTCSDPA